MDDVPEDSLHLLVNADDENPTGLQSLQKRRRSKVTFPSNHARCLKIAAFLSLTSVVIYLYLVFYYFNYPTHIFIQVFHQSSDVEPRIPQIPSSSSSIPYNLGKIIQEWKKEPQACPAPLHVDPNDEFLKLHVKKDVKFTCNYTKPLTYLDQSTALLHLSPEVDTNKTSCEYSFFWRSYEKDNYINYHGIEPLIPGEAIRLSNENDMVNVSCHDIQTGETFYINTHLWIPDFDSKPVDTGPSVLVVFLESLSRLSFERFMKKTKKVLKKLGHVQYLKGFVKPLDNSFPNSVAFLAGERVDWTREQILRKDYFDHKFNYIWDEFKLKKGYVTGFHEDMAVVGVFNYAKWGFLQPPTDWYPRSFWVQMYPESGSFNIWNSMNLMEDFCFKTNGPKIDIFLNQATNFVSKQYQKKQPYFLFTFYSQCTHDDINNYQMVDKNMANFFKSIKHYLNDTILIFAGDHGPRYGSSIVTTAMGRLEERMNLVSIRVPESLNSKYPHLRQFLDANGDRMISWYDLHKMMQDVVDDNYISSESDVRPPPKGPISPWRQLVHPNRTCSDANVDPQYCVCNGNISTDVVYPGWDTKKAQNNVVSYVNEVIKKADGLIKPMCRDQTLNQTLSMTYFIPAKGQSFMTEHILIKVRLMPSLETVEVPMIRNWNDDKPTFGVDFNELKTKLNVTKEQIETEISERICREHHKETNEGILGGFWPFKSFK